MINVDALVAGIDSPLEVPDSGKILLLDADFLIYKAAAKAAKLDTAIRRFYTMVLEHMFLTGCKTARIFITPSTCAKCRRYSYPTVQVYQDQRKKRQELPLKAPLKQHILMNPLEYQEQGITVGASDWFEADDLIIMQSYELGKDCIVCSGDKDMRLTLSPWYDLERAKTVEIDNPYGYLYWNPDASSGARLKGHGRAFFWAQMLMGDSADHVKGILKLDGKNCGEAAAFAALKDFTTEQEAANFVCRAYANINQNVLAEAEMLWLRRSETDSAYDYLMEVVTDDALLEWLMQLHEYHIAHLAWVEEQDSDGHC